MLAAAFFTLLALSGCASFKTALKSFLFSATQDIDRSYPVTGDVSERGTILFQSKPGFWEKLFHNPAPPVPADESEVIVYFDFMSEFQWILNWGVPPERLNDTVILWGDVKKHLGKCDILFGTASHAGKLVIRKESDYPSDEEKQRGVKGATRLFVLDSAVTETVSIEMNDYITTSSFVRHMPPHSWGEFVLGGRAYRIFSVVEGVYYGWRDTRAESTAYEFLRDGQKFQITDNARAVVAELQGDAYTLYDTLPEAERDRMKQALALFYAFRYIARGLL
jgi:hypothetical protein